MPPTSGVSPTVGQGLRVRPMPSAVCPRRPWHFSYRLLYRVIVVLIGCTWHLCLNGQQTVVTLSHYDGRRPDLDAHLGKARYTIRHPALHIWMSIGSLQMIKGYRCESISPQSVA